ncbi:pimeloyl-ACP methyl ester carboxylesterase [Cryobacterium sp. MP_M5]|uniref:alpha/beta fold hydrolase n=1 Tax=unclassified Cryobacterium TaxID=2649013 RepID=UPI001A2337C6|nr:MULTISPECIES: alpha/beta hydrolase [unclassified Cryobacterium]MBG6059790.1 pimeloyl-ACP methyl ester carboxylesterase [Cryobacterium sp. MP_M3]MEC5178131.1 pimeloyl-ACP methyl ester carboxylesterase [Cryobacterium sp. MP_M5]
MNTQHATPPPVTRFLAQPEGRIAYDIQGAGPLVLLVPGMGDLRSTYRFLTSALVAAGYTVATTDLRGHGDSSSVFSSYGDAVTASDLVALLDDLGKPAVVVGNSMGAGAAVIAAADRPELVNGLVLVGPFVREPASNTRFNRLFLRLLMARPWAAAAWKAYLPKLYVGTPPTDFSQYKKDVIASIRRPGYTRAFSLTTRTDHVQAGDSLDRVTAPVLIVMGEKDPDFKDPKAEADWIARTLHGEAVMVPDAGHYPQSQQPERTSAAIIRFLSTLKNHA